MLDVPSDTFKSASQVTDSSLCSLQKLEKSMNLLEKQLFSVQKMITHIIQTYYLLQSDSSTEI